MEAFGLLLWAMSLGGLALVYGLVLAIDGLGRDGWARTDRFYVWTSLLTLPFPLLLLGRSGPPKVPAPFIIVAAMRQMVCIPLFGLGLVLAAVAVWQKRSALALLSTAVLNLGTFAYLFIRGR